MYFLWRNFQLARVNRIFKKIAYFHEIVYSSAESKLPLNYILTKLWVNAQSRDKGGE